MSPIRTWLCRFTNKFFGNPAPCKGELSRYPSLPQGNKHETSERAQPGDAKNRSSVQAANKYSGAHAMCIPVERIYKSESWVQNVYFGSAIINRYVIFHVRESQAHPKENA